MFGDIIQPTHLIFILAVALLVLGPKRLPEVGRSLGKGIRDFRGALSGLEEQTSELHSLASVPLDAEPAAAMTPVTPATVAAPVDQPVDPPLDQSVATVVMATPTPVTNDIPVDPSGVEAAASEPHSDQPQPDQPHPA